MSSTSDPPNADAERRRPVSIMPATEGIDEEWGAEPEAVAQVVVPAPAKMPAIAQPQVAPEPPKKVEAPKKVETPKKSESPRKAESPSPKAPPPSASAPASSGEGGYVAVVAVLAAAGIWWAVRSPEPDHTAPVPVAIAPPPAVSEAPVPATAEPTPLASVAPAATDLPSSSAAPVAAGSAAPSASAASSPAASAQTGETVSVRINITPEGAKLTLKGEEVGKTPMTIELPRGERRVYEVVLKGYAPRRLVIDGTKEEIAYGLKPIEPQP